MTCEEREKALTRLFTRGGDSDFDPLRHAEAWRDPSTRELILHVQELCARRAELGEPITGSTTITALVSRSDAGRDIRALRFGPDYQEEKEVAENERAHRDG